MENHIIRTKAFSRFIQIFDSSFPSGGFVHSFGLEPHIVLGVIDDDKSLKKFLLNIIQDQYQKLEFVYAKKVYKLLEEDQLNFIIKEDNRYSCMSNYEFSKASCDIGKNYLKHIDFNINNTAVKEYFKAIQSEKSAGNEIMVLSAYAYELGLDCDTFLLLWCKKNIVNIAYASLKISRIKPSQIQQLLFEFDDVLEELIKDSKNVVSNFNPLFEEVIFLHKNQEPKLFVT
ncbi:urease accessory protein UreF [Sulfurospirillum sp. 1307]